MDYSSIINKGLMDVSPAIMFVLPCSLTQGEHVASCHVERSFQPTVLRWHPSRSMLAVGWETGEVLLLTHPTGEQSSLPATHSESITLLDWSSTGSRLVTGDQVRSSPGHI